MRKLFALVLLAPVFAFAHHDEEDNNEIWQEIYSGQFEEANEHIQELKARTPDECLQRDLMFLYLSIAENNYDAIKHAECFVDYDLYKKFGD